MFTKLLDILIHTNDQGQTEDGACIACDHPFGQMNHLCFGPLTAVGRRGTHLVVDDIDRAG